MFGEHVCVCVWTGQDRCRFAVIRTIEKRLIKRLALVLITRYAFTAVSSNFLNNSECCTTLIMLLWLAIANSASCCTRHALN